jgi:hypothetical protein
MTTPLTPPGSITYEISQAVEEVACSFDETQTRLSFCKICPHLIINEYTKCELSGCHINLMSSIKFKECPKGHW